jgi:hypothetical protein
VAEIWSLEFPLLQSTEQIAVVPLNVKLGLLRITCGSAACTDIDSASTSNVAIATMRFAIKHYLLIFGLLCVPII